MASEYAPYLPVALVGEPPQENTTRTEFECEHISQPLALVVAQVAESIKASEKATEALFRARSALRMLSSLLPLAIVGDDGQDTKHFHSLFTQSEKWREKFVIHWTCALSELALIAPHLPRTPEILRLVTEIQDRALAVGAEEMRLIRKHLANP